MPISIVKLHVSDEAVAWISASTVQEPPEWIADRSFNQNLSDTSEEIDRHYLEEFLHQNIWRWATELVFYRIRAGILWNFNLTLLQLSNPTN